MTEQLKTLIVEDHQLIVDSYITALEQISKNKPEISFNTIVAKDCDEANIEVEHAVAFGALDLVFLDISLKPSKDKKIISGDDIGIKIRKHFPDTKIIVSTHLYDNFRLINILESFNPNSLLLKNEVTFERLTESILNVIYDIPYYSHSILKLVRQLISNDYNLDQIDRKILYHLSLGTKTKDLPKIINLSLAGIERRKRRLNQIFNNEKKTDKALIKLAREKGFI